MDSPALFEAGFGWRGGATVAGIGKAMAPPGGNQGAGVNSKKPGRVRPEGLIKPTDLRGSQLADPVSASLFEASQDCVKLLDLDGRLLAMNVNGLCLMEIDDFAPLRGSAWETLWPEQSRPMIGDAVDQAAGGHVARFEAECATAKGQVRVWDVIVSPVYDGAGHPTQIVSISQDITEQRRAQEQTALMSLELSHRIKNVFAVVDGVIALSARSEPQSADFAEKLRKRLNALGRATSYVSPSDVGRGDLPVIPTLHGLLQTLLEPYGALNGPTRQLVVEGSDCPVGQSATTAMALVINELATNALKYGALRSPTGHISLNITQVDGTVSLVWRETVEVVEVRPPDVSAGFGTTLLEHSVVRLLKGALQREWLQDGLRVSIQIPSAKLAH